MIPAPYQPVFAALILIGGLIAWAAGYRFFRFVLTIFGFILGVVVTTGLFGAGDRMTLIFAALGGGAIGALVMFFGYFVGVALVGAGVGAFAVHMIWGRLGSDPHPFVVVLAAVAGAAAAMALQRYVIIIATAFGGAWTMLLGGLAVYDQGRSLTKVPEVWMVYPFDPSPGRRWVLGAWALLGLLGAFVQARFTGRSQSPVRVKSKKT